MPKKAKAKAAGKAKAAAPNLGHLPKSNLQPNPKARATAKQPPSPRQAKAQPEDAALRRQFRMEGGRMTILSGNPKDVYMQPKAALEEEAEYTSLHA